MSTFFRNLKNLRDFFFGRRKINFLGVDLFLGYSFDAEFYYLFIFCVFRVIRATWKELQSITCGKTKLARKYLLIAGETVKDLQFGKFFQTYGGSGSFSEQVRKHLGLLQEGCNQG